MEGGDKAMAIPARKFRAEVLSGHKGCAVEIPFDPGRVFGVSPRALWPGRRGFFAKVKINKVAFDSFVVPRSGKFYLVLDDDMQRKAKAQAGSVVDVEFRVVAEGDEDADV
jgi:hypothetical protein